MDKNKYIICIEEKLHSGEWPNYCNPQRMAELDNLADDALSISKIDATTCIASILILQQMTEELLKVLLDSSRFVIQVRLLPLEISFNPLKKAMFGEIVKQIESTINFQHKKEIIELANRMNTTRIEIAHKLIEKDNLADLQIKAIEARNNFEKFLTLYDLAYGWINNHLEELKLESKRVK